MNEYYIYEYVRLDYNEPFYIGKGKGNRWKDKRSRNKYFLNICNHTDVAVVILNKGLDEKTSYEYESYYIWYYRDVLGYNLTNIVDGGEGGKGGNNIIKLSEYEKIRWKNKLSVAAKNQWKNMSKESINKIKNGISKANKNKKTSIETRNKISNKLKGKNNPMYGKTGELNPFYGKHHSEETRNKMSKNHPKAKKTILLKDNKIIKEFNSYKDLFEYCKKNFEKPNGYVVVKKHLDLGTQFHGFYIKYKYEVKNNEK